MCVIFYPALVGLVLGALEGNASAKTRVSPRRIAISFCFAIVTEPEPPKLVHRRSDGGAGRLK